MGMHFAQREVPENKAQVAREMREHDLQGTVGLETRRAFKVAVFHKGDGCRRPALDVVYGLIGVQQRVQPGLDVHDIALRRSVCRILQRFIKRLA